jgi:hypothetical protein
VSDHATPALTVVGNWSRDTWFGRELAVGEAMARTAFEERVNPRSELTAVFFAEALPKHYGVNAASRQFFSGEWRANTTRWTPGPAIPAIAPKQGANGDDHSKQHGLNRPRHDE